MSDDSPSSRGMVELELCRLRRITHSAWLWHPPLMAIGPRGRTHKLFVFSEDRRPSVAHAPARRSPRRARGRGQSPPESGRVAEQDRLGKQDHQVAVHPLNLWLLSPEEAKQLDATNEAAVAVISGAGYRVAFILGGGYRITPSVGEAAALECRGLGALMSFSRRCLAPDPDLRAPGE
jgi:hypothetical protein